MQSPTRITALATFDEFITSIEEEYGEQGKGRPFEVFCKWFLENDPEWSTKKNYKKEEKI